jgi:hypothetical protein
MRRALLAVFLFLGVGAFFGLARAQEPPVHKNVCPRCGKAPEDPSAAKCATDGAPLVRSDLVVFHAFVLRAAREPNPGGLENPFARCVKDGKIDLAVLEKLVLDYKEAAKTSEFSERALETYEERSSGSAPTSMRSSRRPSSSSSTPVGTSASSPSSGRNRRTRRAGRAPTSRTLLRRPATRGDTITSTWAPRPSVASGTS